MHQWCYIPLGYFGIEVVSWAPDISGMVDLDEKIHAVGALAFDIRDSKEKLALDLHTEAYTAPLLELRVCRAVASYPPAPEVKDIEELELVFALPYQLKGRRRELLMIIPDQPESAALGRLRSFEEQPNFHHCYHCENHMLLIQQ